MINTQALARGCFSKTEKMITCAALKTMKKKERVRLPTALPLPSAPQKPAVPVVVAAPAAKKTLGGVPKVKKAPLPSAPVKVTIYLTLCSKLFLIL